MYVDIMFWYLLHTLINGPKSCVYIWKEEDRKGWSLQRALAKKKKINGLLPVSQYLEVSFLLMVRRRNDVVVTPPLEISNQVGFPSVLLNTFPKVHILSQNSSKWRSNFFGAVMSNKIKNWDFLHEKLPEQFFSLTIFLQIRVGWILEKSQSRFWTKIGLST